jgi:thiol-disulfide isomerase/thioredoxin
MNNFKFKLLAAVCVPAILLIVLTVLTLSPRFLAGYSGGQKQLLMLHMDGCPHCVTLMPEWDKFARMNSNTGVTARKVERKASARLIKKYGVTGFPTILLLSPTGRKLATYTGPRDARALLAYAKKHARVN